MTSPALVAYYSSMDNPEEKKEVEVPPTLPPVAQMPGLSLPTEPVPPPLPTKHPMSKHMKRIIVGALVLVMGVLFAVYVLWYIPFMNVKVKLGLPKIVDVTPTETFPSPSPLPTLQVVTTPPFSNTHTWLIRLDNLFYSATKLPKTGVKGRKDVTATLYSPVDDGAYLCRYDDTESVFIERKADAGWTRLCDQFQPTSSTHALHCQKYDASKGIPVSATFYPIGKCVGDTSVALGQYHVHARIYTNCQVDSKNIGDKCKGIVDAVSQPFEVSK